MKTVTGEWVTKAEGDWGSAQREQRVRRAPNPDLVCFLCQQCAEKYLKAVLYESNIRFAKIHDLLELLALVMTAEPTLANLRPRLESLNDYAVEFRYPGETARVEEAKTALADCRVVRIELRRCLGLDEPPTGQIKLQIRERSARYRVRRRRQ